MTAEPAPKRTPPDDTTTPERKRVPVSVDSPGNDGFRYVEEPATPVTAEGSYEWWRTEVARRDEDLERLRAELAEVKAERDAKLRTKALGRAFVEMRDFAERETARAEQAERELAEAKRGGKELGRTINRLADIMRTTVMDGAADPYGVLINLADWLVEADGMTGDEHAPVVAALKAEARSQRQAGELAAVIEQVRAAHPRCGGGKTAFGGPHPWCGTCSVAWPCPTVAALDFRPDDPEEIRRLAEGEGQ